MSAEGIRFCHSGDFDGFFSLNRKKGNTFEGHFGYLASDMIELATRIGSNATFIVEADAGKPIDADGNFDGCIGRLQKNESDILFYTTDYPLEAKNIEQGILLFDTVLVIGQDYYVKKTSKDGQIFDSLDSLYFIMPFIILFVLCIIGLVYVKQKMKMKQKLEMAKYMGKRVRKTNSYCVYYVLVHATRNGTIPDKRFYDRLIFMLLSVFSLYVIHYYNSLIKTSLVVIREPDLWYSYQDLIDMNVRPFFIHGMHDEYYFEFAQVNSSRHKLWKYAVSKYNNSDLIVAANPGNFPAHGIAMMRRKAALIIDLLLAKTVQLAACTFKARDPAIFNLAGAKNMEDLRMRARNFMFHSIIDPSESKIQKGLIMSQYFANRLMKKALRNSIEGGLHFAKLEMVQTGDIFAIVELAPGGQRDPAKSRWVRDCMSDTIVNPHATIVSDIEVVNVGKLFYVFVGCLAGCFLIFKVEGSHLFRMLRSTLRELSARSLRWKKQHPCGSRVMFQNLINK